MKAGKLLSSLIVTIALTTATSAAAIAAAPAQTSIPAAPLTAASAMAAPAVSTTSFLVCPFTDCTASEIHLHNGTSYQCHTLDDGHDYHQACTVSGCTETCLHSHNGNSSYRSSVQNTAGTPYPGRHHGRGHHGRCH